MNNDRVLYLKCCSVWNDIKGSDDWYRSSAVLRYTLKLAVKLYLPIKEISNGIRLDMVRDNEEILRRVNDGAYTEEAILYIINNHVVCTPHEPTVGQGYSY